MASRQKQQFVDTNTKISISDENCTNRVSFFARNKGDDNSLVEILWRLRSLRSPYLPIVLLGSTLQTLSLPALRLRRSLPIAQIQFTFAASYIFFPTIPGTTFRRISPPCSCLCENRYQCGYEMVQQGAVVRLFCFVHCSLPVPQYNCVYGSETRNKVLREQRRTINPFISLDLFWRAELMSRQNMKENHDSWSGSSAGTNQVQLRMGW